MKFTDIVPRWLLILVGILFALIVLIVVFVVIIPALSPQPTVDENPDDQEEPDDGPTTSISDPDRDLDYIYAGIASDDTIVFVDNKDKEVATNLAQMNWKDIRWSPDGDRLSVLGLTKDDPETPIYDLFIYEMGDSSWKQQTYYEDVATGITGYAWVDNNHIALTQGTGSELWVHDYDYDNQEIEKQFQTDGSLFGYFSDSGKYVIQAKGSLDLTQVGGEVIEDNIFRIVDSTGAQLWQFNAFADIGGAREYLEVMPGRSPNELVFKVNVYPDGEIEYYVFDEQEETLEEVDIRGPIENVQISCPFDTNMMYATGLNEQDLRMMLLNLDTETPGTIAEVRLGGQPISSMPEILMDCRSQSRKVIGVQTDLRGQTAWEWFRFGGSDFTKLLFETDFVELVGK